MLKEIYIENLAVIERASIPFSENFNVFTGETGAGKSILINGINAILGHRVSRDIVRTGCNKAIVTALFTELTSETTIKLDELGISYEDDEITITREISTDGRSIARINNRATAVAVLKEIGETLINIHGQHDNQILLASEKHLEVLDNFGGDFSLLEDYRESFRRLQILAKEIGNLQRQEKNKAERMELLLMRIEEIESFSLEENEDGTLENEYVLLQNAEKIAQAVKKAYGLLYNDNNKNAVELIMSAEEKISDFTDIKKDIFQLYERLCTARIEIQDIAESLDDIFNSLDFNESRFEAIVSRRSQLNRIKKKYNSEINDIIKLYNDYKSEISELENGSERIDELLKERDKLLISVTEKAKELSKYRENLAIEFSKQVSEELKFLDMPNVLLRVIQEKGKLTINGMDNIEFLISANKGEAPRPIAKIASGGELSRIMLALKSVIADKDSIPSLIFDEIDTGVSGRAAQKIGIKLKEISKIRQVLCVTHLSQIAVMADNHMLIEKNIVNERTSTNVTKLDFEGRTYEIARIMGGENPSELMLKNAKEELKKAKGK